MERRLAAILAADMVGFSSQMEVDELGTLARLRAARLEVTEPEIAAHGGRVFKTTGDGFLAEFPSAIAALNCAVDMQRTIGLRNADRSPGERTVFRMALNIGDVIIEDGDVYGDGVNIAARLEPLAPPGGVVVSQAVREQLRNKVAVGFRTIGRQHLKNIAEPVEVYRVAVDSPDAGTTGDERAAEPPPDHVPVLAILPFDSMGRDPGQDHIADGITEDLITTLSQIGTLSVVGRNTAFAYKNRTVAAKQVGAELKADFVLTGSVRQAGNRLRITAQLTDARTEVQAWTARYDREIADIFAVQDELTLTIATALQVKLTEGEQARLRYTTTDNVTAWMHFIRGLSLFRTVSADTYRQARASFEQALAHDPDSAQIHAMLACVHAIEGRFYWTADRDRSLALAKRHADEALARDPENADAYAALGYWHMCYRRLDEATAAYARAVELAPDHADLRALYALALTFAERADEAIAQAQAAIRLNPLNPGWYRGVLGHAFRYAGRLDDAAAVLSDYNRCSPGFGLVDLVLTHADAGDPEQAAQCARDLLAARPDFTVERWGLTQNCVDLGRLETDRKSLAAAGLP